MTKPGKPFPGSSLAGSPPSRAATHLYLRARDTMPATSLGSRSSLMTSPPPRVLLVAEHASARFGGEAILPLHYFRVLRARGVETWMIVHERTRDELTALFPTDKDRLYFVPDQPMHR